MGQRYRHYSGKEYEIVAIGMLTESEDLQQCVVYRSLYNDPKFGPNPAWIRPLTMIVEEVTVNNKLMPRFTLIK